MPSRPNIILIHTDQQRGDCLSVDGHPDLLTPNLDGFAARGVRFRNAYTPSPICSAARHSMLTGCSPATNGVLDNSPVRIARPEQTLPNLLRQAGYQTVHVGRSMHQYPPAVRYGFEYCDQQPRLDVYSVYHQQMPLLSNRGQFNNFPHHLNHALPLDSYAARDWPYDEFLHQTNFAVNRGIEMIERRDREAPLFLSVGIVAPHPPLVPPRFYYDRYRGMELRPPVVGDWVEEPVNNHLGEGIYSGHIPLGTEAIRAAMSAYYGLINHIDDQLFNLFGRIAAEHEKTYIIFLSDHGEMLGDHRMFRKIRPFQGSVRVPFIMAGPGLSAGTVLEHPVTFEDLLPTCMDMAGLPIPGHVEGRSLFRLVQDPAIDWRAWTHSESSATAGMGHAGWHMLTDGKEKYIWWTGDGREMFFDLQADPRETRNLTATAVDRLDAWRRRLIAHLKDRPEGFVNASGQLQAGMLHQGVLPHAVPV